MKFMEFLRNLRRRRRPEKPRIEPTLDSPAPNGHSGRSANTSVCNRLETPRRGYESPDVPCNINLMNGSQQVFQDDGGEPLCSESYSSSYSDGGVSSSHSHSYGSDY